jgi:hypothetical protein
VYVPGVPVLAKSGQKKKDTSCIFDLSLKIACHCLRAGNVENIAVLTFKNPASYI